MSEGELREVLAEAFSEVSRLGMPQPEHLADAVLTSPEFLANRERYAREWAAEELRALTERGETP